MTLGIQIPGVLVLMTCAEKFVAKMPFDKKLMAYTLGAGTYGFYYMFA